MSVPERPESEGRYWRPSFTIQLFLVLAVLEGGPVLLTRQKALSSCFRCVGNSFLNCSLEFQIQRLKAAPDSRVEPELE